MSGEELLKAEILSAQASVESGMGTEVIAQAILNGEWLKEFRAIERISGLGEAAHMITEGMAGDETDYPALKEARGHIEEKVDSLVESLLKAREDKQ